jgi:regulator of sigma E protease
MSAAVAHYAAWLAPIFVFGVVVFVHEFGHFLAAKLTGVYAPRFSIGFGPALWSRRFGETEYRLSALPFGGYVRMASRDDEAAAMLEGGSEEGAEGAHEGDPDLMMPFGTKPIPENRWFESKSLPARLLIMLSGVGMNILLAFVVLTGIAAYYGVPEVHTVVGTVVPNSPAAAAGFQVGDSIVAIDGAPMKTWEDVLGKIHPAIGVPLAVDVVRGGVGQTLRVTPGVATDTTDSAQGKPVTQKVGKIGLGVRVPTATKPMPLGRAIAAGGRLTANLTGMILQSLRDLATGRASFAALRGPVGIAQVSVQAARTGIEELLILLAAISLNVAIFNLLPIPILDGGQIVMTVIESAKGRPLSLRTRELVLRAGLLAIALLVVLVMYNDRCVIPGLC